MPIKPPTHFAQPANRGRTVTQQIPWTAGAKQLADQMTAAFQMMYGMKVEQQKATDRQTTLGLAKRNQEIKEASELRDIEHDKWAKIKAIQDIRDKIGANPQLDQILMEAGLPLGGAPAPGDVPMPASEPMVAGPGAPEPFVGPSQPMGINYQPPDDTLQGDAPQPPDLSGLSADKKKATLSRYGKELDIYQKRALGTSQIQTFEAATEFGPEDRDTKEYKKAFVQFQQDIAQAKYIAPPSAKFVGPKFAMDLRKQFDALPEVKDYKETARKHSVMGKAWDTAQSTENFVAVDQALITLFNKMTDPESVVRESEYLRTSTDLAIWNRLKGKMTKVKAGGAGLSMDDRRALMEMGDKFMNAYSDVYKRTGRQYRGYATKNQIDPEDVVPLENLQIPQFGAPGGPSEGKRKLPTF